MTSRSSIIDKAPVVLFLLSVFGAGAAYGFLAHHSKLFPYRLVKQAESAYTALRTGKSGNEPTTFLAYVPERTSPTSASRIATEQPDDWILVTGGPYEFLEECPRFGCLAWIIDRDGKVIHHWEADLEALWREADHITGDKNPRNFLSLGTELLPDGSILVAFQNDRAFPEGAGLAKFDRDGGLVWRGEDLVNHWFTLGPDGTIYAPGHSVLETPAPIGNTRQRIICNQVKAQADYVAIIGPDGKTRERIDVMDLLVDNGYVGLVRLTNDPCDPFHLNFVQYVDEQMASRLDRVDAGDLLISLRNVSTILIFSPRTRAIKWIDTGRYIEQHSPRFLPDGSLVVFDNKGGDAQFGGARIVRLKINDDLDGGIDDETGQRGFSVVAPRAGVSLGGDFTSERASKIAVGPKGDRLLIALTQMGEIVEIDLDSGAPLWRYDKIFTAEGYPGAAPDDRRSVRVEAFGASYVDKSAFAAVFGAPEGHQVSSTWRN
jgi:hypothetical protein